MRAHAFLSTSAARRHQSGRPMGPCHRRPRLLPQRSAAAAAAAASTNQLGPAAGGMPGEPDDSAGPPRGAADGLVEAAAPALPRARGEDAASKLPLATLTPVSGRWLAPLASSAASTRRSSTSSWSMTRTTQATRQAILRRRRRRRMSSTSPKSLKSMDLPSPRHALARRSIYRSVTQPAFRRDVTAPVWIRTE